MTLTTMPLVLTALLVVPASARAQVIATPPVAETPPAAADVPERRTGLKTLFRDLGGDFAHLPSRDSLVVASVGGAAALAVHPFDTQINSHLGGTSFFDAGDRLGSTTTIMVATFGVYGVSLAAGRPRVTHVALDVVRAELVSEAMVQTIKISVQRPRPDGSSGYSFPSGHSAATFAIATVLQRHHGLKVALPAYAFASYVSASRLHDNVHFMSDIVFGAAVGTIAGRTVTRHGATNFALAPMFVPGGVGLAFVR